MEKIKQGIFFLYEPDRLPALRVEIINHFPFSKNPPPFKGSHDILSKSRNPSQNYVMLTAILFEYPVLFWSLRVVPNARFVWVHSEK